MTIIGVFGFEYCHSGWHACPESAYYGYGDANSSGVVSSKYLSTPRSIPDVLLPSLVNMLDCSPDITFRSTVPSRSSARFFELAG